MSVPRRWLIDDEEMVAELRAHWVTLGWPLFAMIVAVGAVVAMAIVLSSTPVWLGDAQLAVLLVVAAWLALRWARRSATSVVLTDRRLVARAGLFGRTGTALRLDQIIGVSYHQSFAKRIIGCGDLVVESTGESGSVVFPYVHHPAAVQNLLTEQVALDRERHFNPLGRGAAGPGVGGDGGLAHEDRFVSYAGRAMPAARVEPGGSTTPPVGVHVGAHEQSAARSVAARLKELAELRRQGLVSEAEYDSKRRQLLDQL